MYARPAVRRHAQRRGRLRIGARGATVGAMNSGDAPRRGLPGLPARFLRPRRAFFANLLGLFFGNEAETRALAAEVGEVDTYGGRLIPIIDLVFRGGGNTLLLEREPDPDLCAHFVETLGLTLPRVEVLSHAGYVAMGRALQNGDGLPEDLGRLVAAGGPGWVDGYVTDETVAAFAAKAGWRTIASIEGSRRGNNKRLLHEFLCEADLPVVETAIAGSPEEVERALVKLRASGFAAAGVKSAIGASGIGLLKFSSLDDPAARAAEVPGHFFYEGPCLVQGWLSPGGLGVTRVRSPSAQLFLDDERVYLYDLTEQILSRASVHEGNESPPPYLRDEPALRSELLRQAGLAGQWLHRQGYRGTGSVDFLVVDRAGSAIPEVYVCEINARVTGATYPSILARHFMPEGAWLLRNLRFREPLTGRDLLAALRDSGDLFVPGRTENGLVPLNFNVGRDGLVHKGQFLCLAHSPAGSHVLLEIAELDLPCEPDRD